MAYRRKSEGLVLSAKGKKEGVNGKVANFFVAIFYKKSIVLCEQYMEQINGDNFSTFVRKHFPAAFQKSSNYRMGIQLRIQKRQRKLLMMLVVECFQFQQDPLI